jgi:hypothetical protein
MYFVGFFLKRINNKMEGILTYFRENTGMILILAVGLIVIFACAGAIWAAVRGNPASVMVIGKNNHSAYGRVMNLAPLGASKDNTRLCDYYIASSAYSVFPGAASSDYISDQMIPLVIKDGARLIELDVYAGDNDVPVVGLKNEALGYDYAYNSVTFDACCVAVANSAFNPTECKVSSDPFVLSLVFHTDKRNVIDAAAEILKNTCRRYMLGLEYSYNSKNVAQEPIINLMGKLIIVSGPSVKGTNMEELVNLSWATSNLRRLTYMQASQPYDHDELITSNRTNITMVVPSAIPDLKNNNPTILFSYGCQWNLMNYGSIDAMQEIYIGKFQDASLVMKPEELRYKPVEAKTPVLPDPATHSFQPMAHTSPIYDSNPVTGDKSIVI